MPSASETFARRGGAIEWGQLRGHPGFVRLARHASGMWWLLDPDDRPFLSRGVAGIGAGLSATTGNLPQLVAEKFSGWHCNTVGLDSAPGIFPAGAYELAVVPFCSAFPDTLVRAGGLFLPDVFDARWVDACREVASHAGHARRFDPALLAYVVDASTQWEPKAIGSKSLSRPRLLQICLSLEPRYAAYHAAWEFVLAAHGGDWDRLLRDWAQTWPNREALRQKTLAEEAISTPGFLRDQENFLREFSRRYFQTAADALRLVDPHHLIFGGDSPTAPSEAIRAAVAAAEIDALSLALPDGVEADAVGAILADVRLPVLVSGLNWTADKYRRLNATRGRGARSGVEMMLANGRASMQCLQQHPAVVGYAWSDWQDGPEEMPPYGRGLLRRDGSEAWEHSELFSLLNLGAEKRRWAAQRRRSAAVLA